MKKTDLVADRDTDEALAREDGRFRRPANGGESALTERAFGLNLSPFHDANKAKIVITAIDISSTCTIAILNSFTQTNSTNFRFRFSFIVKFRFSLEGAEQGS